MADVEVNEMGLLDDFNYEEHPQGQIDMSDEFAVDQKKSNKKSKKKQEHFTEIAIDSNAYNDLNANDNASTNKNSNNNNNNNNLHNVDNAKPNQNNNLSDCQRFTMGVFNWIQLRSLCFFGNLAIFIFLILDAKFNSPGFLEWVLSWYIWIFSAVGMLIESPTWWLTKTVQLKIYLYARFLRRASGRAFFYTSVAMLSFAGVQDHVTITMFAGIYMLVVSIMLMVFSMMAAKQMKAMFAYMMSGADEDTQQMNPAEQEGSPADKMAAWYHRLDHNRTNKLGADGLYSLGQHALNRKLSNSERYAIQCYLDDGCNGFIKIEDWCKQFLNCNNVKFL
eukprot:CAMPEP_0202688006 /NCGR_PEP_ID=MMETSP1385-20130828/3539_1 /ASSEMBLY_ACC=CAM_ASM_000861 /TAXON_ID=933848 /ORGANISM="Elphidium margaritaceum" /LENGTH=334 /DNA_ID=CAMNT_0049342875 /DNA_START=24 /DNA_END=1028 /DNA_ORIENTATION=+